MKFLYYLGTLLYFTCTHSIICHKRCQPNQGVSIIGRVSKLTYFVFFTWDTIGHLKKKALWEWRGIWVSDLQNLFPANQYTRIPCLSNAREPGVDLHWRGIVALAVDFIPGPHSMRPAVSWHHGPWGRFSLHMRHTEVLHWFHSVQQVSI